MGAFSGCGAGFGAAGCCGAGRWGMGGTAASCSSRAIWRITTRSPSRKPRR
ncbi:MAG: hypothetical protein ACLUIX_01675 [Oscillospiraceae bacterium]